jgi:hypothetical protein
MQIQNTNSLKILLDRVLRVRLNIRQTLPFSVYFQSSNLKTSTNTTLLSWCCSSRAHSSRSQWEAMQDNAHVSSVTPRSMPSCLSIAAGGSTTLSYAVRAEPQCLAHQPRVLPTTPMSPPSRLEACPHASASQPEGAPRWATLWGRSIVT